MSYLAPIHKPTSVRHAIKLCLLSPKEECLVLAKSNRLEIYTLGKDGLSLEHTRPIYGKILMLEKIRPAPSATDHLFIGTDRYVYFTVSWNPESGRLETEKAYVDQSDKSSRDSATHDRCLIDPSKHFMALFLYDGIVSILPLSTKGKRKGGGAGIDQLGDPVQSRISALAIKSCAFLHPKDNDRVPFQLALLFEDSLQKTCFSVRALEYAAGVGGETGAAELENELAFRDDLELGSSHLIPVPSPVHGILILGQTCITYFLDANGRPLTRPLDELTSFVAWAAVDEFRWLLADDFGQLYLLMLLADETEAVSWKLDKLGRTSSASVLVYLDQGYVFVGSHQGDSQVVRIQQDGMEVVQTIPNIAPILDFTVMDMGNRAGEGQTNEYSSGQARIVTGSGVFADGSLRSVRSGVGLEEQGVIGEMENATDLFALQSTPSISSDDILVVSFINETRIFQFGSDSSVEEKTDFKSLSLRESTLLALMLDSTRVLQITNSAALMIDLESGMVVDRWTDPGHCAITSASANQSELMLALEGRELAAFTIAGEIVLRSRRSFPEGQIACIHTSGLRIGLGLIGFWQGATIIAVSTTNLEVLSKAKISDDMTSVPRALLLSRLLSPVNSRHATLLVSAANGEVITFSLDLETYELSSRTVTILGTQQANLKTIPRGTDGLQNVFASCDHPSLIYGLEDRIIFSGVTAELATSICAFDSEAYPNAIALATQNDIRIAFVDTERTTHVQPTPIGELVRRIAYSSTLKAFGIGTIHRRLEGQDEILQSHFKLADDVVFGELDRCELRDEELVESVMCAEIRQDGGEYVERFVVGTTFTSDEQDDATQGRILVFAVTAERKLKLVTELPVKGACRTLGCLEGNIVAGLVKTVVLYTLRNSRLHKLCAYRTSTAPIDIAIHAPSRQIAVADLMKSVSIVTYYPPDPSKPGDTLHKLLETARHFSTGWSTAVTRVGDGMWLESDAEGNLIVLFQDTGALSADDKKRLRVVSRLRLGEMVNRIRPIHIKTSPAVPVMPKAFMATVEGGVYLYGQIGQDYLDLLISLQAALAPMVESLGHVPFNSYRAFRNEVVETQEPLRFVDGELVEAFLELPGTIQDTIVNKLGDVAKAKGGTEGVREVIETLRRLH